MYIILTTHVQVGKVSQRPGNDDDKTLADLKFVIGDYLDIAIELPSYGGQRRR